MDEVPLVRRINDFDAFYRAEYRSVLGLAIVLTGSRSAAEEITQDAFLAAYRSWDRIGRYESPAGWIRRVVSNRSVSRFRRSVAEGRALVKHGKPDDLQPDTAESADIDLWRAVRRLPARQAQAIALTYLLDLSRKEVAGILGCSPETVKTHLARARTALSKRLGSEYKDSHEH